ncbi:GNAT family N-acetyltransferase [Cnuibacter sp. UC19_7]|uniref:GNAT family N-acetyltransferase n=1 Tax=Cnuibacter sp. UC19_7 TaxID=3350166 RepID=UPI00366AFEAB
MKRVDRRMHEPPEIRAATVDDACGIVIAGWASFGPGRDEGESERGELPGLYTHPETFSTGVGHDLIAEVERRLRAAGFASAYLWVLEGNDRAAGFYERHGWIGDGTTKHIERPGMTLFERRHATLLA